MGDYETVTEVKARVDFQIQVPLAMGDNVAKGIEDLLTAVEKVRYVTGIEPQSIEKKEDTLTTNAMAAITFHLPRPFDDEIHPAVQTLLAEYDAISAVNTIDIRESYPVEKY